MKFLLGAFVAVFLQGFVWTQENVIRPPKIEKGPNATIFRQFNKVLMTCEATGSPDPSFYWTKDGKRFSKNTHGIRWLSDGTFEIVEARKRDSGTYQCFAVNKYGTAMSQKATIQAAEFGTIVETGVTDYTGNQGTFLKITCNPLKSYPQPQYSWVVTKTTTDTSFTPVEEDDRVSIDHEGNLQFANLEMGDARGGDLYKCNIYNNFENTTKGGSYSRITVIPGPGGTGANVPITLKYTSPSPTTVVRGAKKAELKCFFSGNPTPGPLQWRRTDGKPFHRNHDAAQKPHTLVFNNVVDENEGEYQCHPAGRQAMAGRITLNVDVKPTWMKLNSMPQKPSDANVTVGGNHTFVCAGEGKPAMTTTWYIDAKPVASLTPRRGVEISHDKRTMIVSDVQKERADGSSDLMNVQCALENKHGMQIGGAYLNVLLPTKIPERGRPQNWQLEYRKPIIFNCEAESDPSTEITVTWLWNGRPINFGDPIITKLPNNSLSIVTENKDMSGAEFAGEFECIASNQYSEDRAGAQLKLPEGPIPEYKSPGYNKAALIGGIVGGILLLGLLVLMIALILIWKRRFPV